MFLSRYSQLMTVTQAVSLSSHNIPRIPLCLSTNTTPSHQPYLYLLARHTNMQKMHLINVGSVR